MAASPDSPETGAVRPGPGGHRLLLRGLPAALAFLTVLPVRRLLPGGDAGIERAVPWFPAAGAVAGGAMALACRAGDLLSGTPVGAALAVAAGLLITGGLHADGLADTVDGLAGGRGDRERALRIMRDGRVGSLGAAALFASLLLRFAAVSATAGPYRWPGLVCAAVTARTAVVLALSGFAYARPGGGTGAAFARRLSPHELVFAFSSAALLVALAGGPAAFLAAAASLSAGLACAAAIAAAIGGLTGDSYGAVCEVAEVVFLLAWSVR